MESMIEPFAVTNDSDRTPSCAHGEDAAISLHLGSAYAQQGCYEQALEAFQKAISLQPDSAQAYLGLGGVYFEMRCRQEAANAFQQAARLQPDLMEAHYGYGICSSLMGRSDEAISALEKARTLISTAVAEPSIAPSDPSVPGPISQKSPLWRDRLRISRSGYAMLLTGSLVVLGTGAFLSSPNLRSEPNASTPNVQVKVQKPIKVQKQDTTLPKQITANPPSVLPAGRVASAASEALIHAVESDDLKAARKQLDAHVSANTRRADGTPLLIYATNRGDLPMVDAFLEHNADPNAVSDKGITALMDATLNADLKTVKLLVKHGANVDAHAGNHDTALTLAAALGKADMVKELLDLGADPGQTGENGKTAMQTAREMDRQDIVTLLKKFTARSGHDRSHLFAR